VPNRHVTTFQIHGESWTRPTPHRLHPSSECTSFGLQCTHRTRTIFDLHLAVRRQIYCEAGLRTDSVINLGPWPRPIWPCVGLSERFLSPTTNSILNLLLICRKTYVEAHELLYSTNSSMIDYGECGSLQPLRDLSPRSISLLTHLSVHLNLSPCTEKVCLPDHSCHKYGSPLRSSASKSQQIWWEWQSAAWHLAAHIKPARLEIHFACDVEDISTAISIISPLVNVPTLASCRARLNKRS
jgi:hypothetical protein